MRLIAILIFIIGILLALNVCLLPRFINDDADVIYIAVSLINHGSKFLFGYIHGVLPFYLVKLSGILFGISPFGWRIINLFFNIVNLYLFYMLLLQDKRKLEANLVLALAAFNCYFIFYSAYVCEEIFLFFFSILSILSFYKFIKYEKVKYLFLTSVFIGLGLLVKIQILLLLPGFAGYILTTSEIRKILKAKHLFISLLIIFLLGLPYLYSLYELPIYTKEFTKHMLSLFRPSLKLFSLFIINPLGMNKEDLNFWLGYNNVGLLLGLPCILAVFLTMRQKKDKFIKLMQLIFWGIFVSSIFIFCGEDTEARHYSLAIIPTTALLSLLLGKFFIQKKATQKFVILYIVLLLLQANIFSLNFKYFAGLHSKVPLAAWGYYTKEVDLNELSKKFINLSDRHKPSLVVFPSPLLDSTGYFVTAYTGLKTLSPIVKYAWNYLGDADIKNILFFLTPGDDPVLFLAWANRNGYKTRFNNKDKITVNANGTVLSLPITILMLTQESVKKIKDVELIPKIPTIDRF